jgi:hypothetical protein
MWYYQIVGFQLKILRRSKLLTLPMQRELHKLPSWHFRPFQLYLLPLFPQPIESILLRLDYPRGLPDPVSDNSDLNSDKSVSETVLSLLASLYGATFFKTQDLFRKYVAGDEKAGEAVGALQALTHRRGRFENAIALGQALGVLVDREVWVDGTKMRLCRGPRVASVTTWQVAGAANSSAKRPKTAQEGTQRGGGDPQHGKGSKGP